MVNVQSHLSFSNDIIILNLESYSFWWGKGGGGGRAERKEGGGGESVQGPPKCLYIVTWLYVSESRNNVETFKDGISKFFCPAHFQNDCNIPIGQLYNINKQLWDLVGTMPFDQWCAVCSMCTLFHCHIYCTLLNNAVGSRLQAKHVNCN